MKIDPIAAGRLYASGMSVGAVAAHMGVATMTAYRAILVSGERIRSKFTAAQAAQKTLTGMGSTTPIQT